MALNKSVFKTRALTAVIFVAVMLTGLCTHAYSFFILFSIVHFGAWWEYFNLTDKITNSISNIFTRLGFASLGYAVVLWATADVYQLSELYLRENFCLFFSAAGFLLTITGVFKTNRISSTAFQYAGFGLLYISLSIALLVALAGSSYYTNSTITSWLPYGILLPGFIIVCMWVNDTMAYLVGSFIGKTPLSSISPKKTWEGTIGGIVLCGLVAGISMYFIDNNTFLKLPVYSWILLAFAAAVLGTLGDLFESKIKRMANVKDSGNFMPGHGGFLDRFDSLIFATPYMWLLFQLFLNN